MNRTLQYFNLVAVLGLAVLCVIQWKQNSQLHQISLQNEKLLQERSQQITEQKTQLDAAIGDLARFKEQYGSTHRDLTENTKQLKMLRQENLNLASEAQNLKGSLSNWMQAATLRDTRIEEANGRIKKLAEDLVAAAQKYNELGSNYNSVVKELNEAKQSLQNRAAGVPKKAE